MDPARCSIAGCEQPVVAKALCRRHYQRLYRRGDIELPPPPPVKPCTVPDCDQPARTRGYCNRHYMKWRRYGDPLAGRTRDAPPARCAVDGCEREARAGGQCRTHADRQKHGQDLEAPIAVQPKLWRGMTCTEAGCEREVYAKGLCRRHYERTRVRMRQPMSARDDGAHSEQRWPEQPPRGEQ